jgi:hypothetical protein
MTVKFRKSLGREGVVTKDESPIDPTRPMLARERFGDACILVELPGAPKAVVPTDSASQAWTKYCRLLGIRGTDHTPKFKPGSNCLINPAGIVVDQNNFQQFADLKKSDSREGNWELEDDDLNGTVKEVEVE